MTTAGQLRERVTFQRQADTSDIYGNAKGTWADHLTVWADFRETTGKERIAAGRVESARTATMRVRGSSNIDAITTADRVAARGESWNIRSIAQADRRGAFVDMLLEAGVAT